MDVEQSVVTKIKLSDINDLDPITIFLEDFSPRKGKITIECYGESWSSYWGGMGDKSIAEFFVSCNNCYLAKNLSSMSPEVKANSEQLQELVKKEIIKLRKNKSIDANEARDLYEESDSIDTNFIQSSEELLIDIYGDEWWCLLPQVPNSKYNYLCRIIDATREGLKIFLNKNKEKAEKADIKKEE